MGLVERIILISCVSSPWLSLAVHAQTPTSAPIINATPTDGGLDDIVVTAQKRSENLQSVPVTIAVQTAAALKAADIRSTADLTLVVPGLRANVQSGYFQPFIRGVGGSSTLPGNESPVAVYIDGLYVSLKEANTFELNNIERIEVLKGPQGTLFGRNATGGAINIVTKAPSDHAELNGDVTYGRFDDVIVNAYGSTPITDTLSGNAAIRYENIGDGYQRNIITGTELGTGHSLSAMGKLRWEPTSSLTVTEEFIFTKRRTVDDDQGTANPAVPVVGATAGTIVATTPYQISQNTDPDSRITDYKNILNIRYDFGGVSLVSITGLDHANAYSATERDRTSAIRQRTDARTTGREVTQELQLQSNGTGPFKWIAGLYYFSDREGYKPFRTLLRVPGYGTVADLASVSGQPGVTYRLIDSTQNTKSYAGFAEANYNITDDTRITAGIRYTDEKRTLLGTSNLLSAPPPGNAFVYTLEARADQSATFKKPTWRLAVDHHLDQDLMVFASYNRGFRSGAFNPSTIPANQNGIFQAPLKPEIIDAYEAGIKSELFDRRLRLNASAFYYDYRDLHVSVRTPITGAIVQQNAGGAEVFGVDADFAAQPFEGLTLTGGVEWLHARYTDYANASTYILATNAAGALTGGGVQVTVANARGQPLAFAPNFTANLGVQYDLPLRGGSRLSLQGNYFYTDDYSRQVGTVFGVEEVQAYSNLNASVTWHAPGDRYYVTAWGRNLTDHKILGSSLDSFAYFYVVQRPATYGFTLGFALGR